ncbi:uncharacterized protein LOC143358285 isoform X2 [Halictus rubicundus]|uniref:uncharacterized protein LOC143358285 isoform X2 n=1 Tax=Halictus rubicundus TaxID=77578 RepID=UPI004035A97D
MRSRDRGFFVLTLHDSVGTRCLSERGLGGSKTTNQGLFKDAFKFKTTPENPIKSRPRGRRLLGMASRRFLSPEPVSPSVEKENSNTGRSPRGISPQKMPLGSKKCRYPLEDCDPNSQDSGYEASCTGKEEKPREAFRFLEPMAVAPRRMSIECRSPIESPIRSSPQQARAIRPSSLFRTISSGYESMDDGFNDLIDVEPLEDSRVTQHQLPNGISTLLSGDIVGTTGSSSSPLCEISSSVTKMDTTNSPSTPEFPRTNRTGNFRRSLFLQNEKPETRKNSTLSKVRSCLFRSPNVSPTIGVADLSFEDGPLTHRLTNARATATATRTTTAIAIASTTTAATVPTSHRRRIFYRDEPSNDTDTNANGNGNIDSPVFVKTFKRPDPPIDDSPKLVKRSRKSGGSFSNAMRHYCCSTDTPISSPPFAGITFQRSLSETSATIAVVGATKHYADTDEIEIEIETESHALIESAIRRSTTDTDLTGDFSKPCVLPLAVGHHEDLKSISTDTLVALIRGEFNDRVDSFQIIDCRYPYEFDAGHIRGALNLYSKDLIERNLLDPLTDTPEIQPDTNKRNILVFHCEFSWERGPNLSRFLRHLDRQRNKEHYPALHYPEVYLLHGGYQQFYKEQKGLCLPQGYRPMRHPDHEADLRKFRNKSKSWQGEKSRITGNNAIRTNLKRLDF